MTGHEASPPPTAEDVIARLGLEPHPEGGHFLETFRDPHVDADGRAASTAIYYLLAAGERSHWHRVDAAEVWHWYAGAPLTLTWVPDEPSAIPIMATLGGDLVGGERPQVVVPTGAWQSAESVGDWTLVGCTVAPGFSFEGFEMARPGWSPGQPVSD